MKYRHVFHAGNFADVMKHVALVAALLRLTEKDRPLFLLDTHAGRGRYGIVGRGGEAGKGIARLEAARPAATHPALSRYLDIVRGLNPAGGLDTYPGSPFIAATLMRANDRAAFCELLPTEAEALKQEFWRDARIGVHCRDGFEALGALLPPAEKRGLTLIDPPYEEQDVDFARVADALVAASGALAARRDDGLVPDQARRGRGTTASASAGCRSRQAAGRGTVRLSRRLARGTQRLGARDDQPALAVR